MVQRLFDMLDSDLSPENLYCDGKRPWAQVKKRAQLLRAAGQELIKKGFRSNRWDSKFK